MPDQQQKQATNAEARFPESGCPLPAAEFMVYPKLPLEAATPGLHFFVLQKQESLALSGLYGKARVSGLF